jgi:hypothetical protein
MTTHIVRADQYYSALVGRGRQRVAPTMREARLDLRRAIEVDLSVHGV